MNTENRKSGHLTANEISQWLIEGPVQGADRHVQNCKSCQAKLAGVQAPLSVFRGALVQWSEAQMPRSYSHPASDIRNTSDWGRRLWVPAAGFALAALLVVGYSKVPALLHGNPNGHPVAATASATADSDEALLDQVDTEVSEAVPDAMAPLTDLVAWDSSEASSSQTTAAEKRLAHKASAKPAIVKTPVAAEN